MVEDFIVFYTAVLVYADGTKVMLPVRYYSLKELVSAIHDLRELGRGVGELGYIAWYSEPLHSTEIVSMETGSIIGFW